MRAHGPAGHVDLSFIPFDDHGDHLSYRKRGKGIDVTAANGNVRQGSPVTGVAFFGMNADSCITGIARKSTALLKLYCHTCSLLPKTLVEAYCSTAGTGWGNYVGTGGSTYGGLCTSEDAKTFENLTQQRKGGLELVARYRKQTLDCDASGFGGAIVEAFDEQLEPLIALCVCRHGEFNSHAASGHAGHGASGNSSAIC